MQDPSSCVAEPRVAELAHQRQDEPGQHKCQPVCDPPCDKHGSFWQPDTSLGALAVGILGRGEIDGNQDDDTARQRKREKDREQQVARSRAEW